MQVEQKLGSAAAGDQKQPSVEIICMGGFVPAPSLSPGSVVAHEVDDYAGRERTPAQRPKHHVDHWNGLVLERSIRLQARAENYII